MGRSPFAPSKNKINKEERGDFHSHAQLNMWFSLWRDLSNHMNTTLIHFDKEIVVGREGKKRSPGVGHCFKLCFFLCGYIFFLIEVTRTPLFFVHDDGFLLSVKCWSARRPSGGRIIAQIHFRNGYLFFLLLRLAEGTTSKASCWLAVYTQNKRTRTEENKEGCADTTDSTQGKVYNGTRLSGVLLFVFTFVKWGLSLLTETLWGEKNKKKSFFIFQTNEPRK